MLQPRARGETDATYEGYTNLTFFAFKTLGSNDSILPDVDPIQTIVPFAPMTFKSVSNLPKRRAVSTH